MDSVVFLALLWVSEHGFLKEVSYEQKSLFQQMLVTFGSCVFLQEDFLSLSVNINFFVIKIN